MSKGVRTAFVLCAGWGKRLQPLTDQIPKPLVPICGLPLCEFALTRLAAAGVERIVINTHRLPDQFIRLFPEYPHPSRYAGVPVFFRHEPLLLDTAGGLKNVEDLLLPGPVLVHNGDILAELDLAALVAAHAHSGALCTLALRTSGGPLQVGFDAASGRVTDLRGELGSSDPRFLYTGVCVIAPELLGRINPGQPASLVTVWLEALRAGQTLAGVVLDRGEWRDIGNLGEYLRIHADLASGEVTLVPPPTAPPGWPLWRMPGSRVAPDAELSGWNWLGPGCEVGPGARGSQSVLWAGSKVLAHAVVANTVVREGMRAEGRLEGSAL